MTDVAAPLPTYRSMPTTEESSPSVDTLKPDSPCVGRCSTAYGDEICRGCGRTFEEVINWIVYTDEEKAAVWARLRKA